jgi:hypothetical protein
MPRVSTEVAASIAQRATLLDPPERLLLEQLYVHGWPAARVARLTGEPARVVRCRASRLVRRVLSPAFQVVTTRSGCWPRQLQRVGHDVFVRGRTLRATAKDLGLSYYHVSQLVGAVRAIAEAARAEARQSWKRGAA